MSYRFKKRRRADDHGGLDDWLMTYADMITLLLCFFAVFLSVSVPKKEAFSQARQTMIEQFSSQNIIAGKFPTPPSPSSKSGGTYNALPSIVDRYHTGEGRSIGSGVDAGEGQSEGMGEGAQQGRDQRAQETIDGRSAPEGDRIQTIDIPSAAFFASGSAELSTEGKRILGRLLDNQLKPAIGRGYRITVEGHTDDVPIHTLQFPSNWELSTARAAAVVRFFIEQGVDPQYLRASGYADVFPKVPNRDENGNAIPENQAKNRRVLIKLEKIERQE